MRGNGLIGELVEVAQKMGVVDRCRGSEQFDGSFGSYESVTAEWGELADWLAVSSDDEGLPFDEGAHYLAAVVSEFSLADLSTHGL